MLLFRLLIKINIYGKFQVHTSFSFCENRARTFEEKNTQKKKKKKLEIESLCTNSGCSGEWSNEVTLCTTFVEHYKRFHVVKESCT